MCIDHSIEAWSHCYSFQAKSLPHFVRKMMSSLLSTSGSNSTRLIAAKLAILFFTLILTASCSLESARTRPAQAAQQITTVVVNVDDLLIVDCLLPGQIKRLGSISTFVSARRPIKTTAVDCGIRGGEFVAYDRSDYQTARKIWLAEAENGGAKAQNYLGEIYEKGLGINPNYRLAVEWYERAANQGYASAQINLGKLYESGRGVPKDMEKALYWYRQASGISSLLPAPELQLEDDTVEGTGPTIQIIDPIVPPTRGLMLVSVKPDIKQRLIIGRVIAPEGLLTLTVNDKQTPVEKNGIFQASVPVKESGTKVSIVAIDKKGNRSIRTIVLKRAERIVKQAGFGRYYALVIGNNNYKYLNSLSTAQSDAKSISAILREKYNFQVTTLYDANRFQILDALNKLRKTLTEEDNLLIYYAGHGILDEKNDRGNWLPVDAEPDSTANWISNIAITDILNIMSAKHVLVIADACYSGSMTRSVLTQLRAGQSDAARKAYIRAVQKKRSRTALTSGGLAPVLDSGKKGHSVFANALIDVLHENQVILEGQRLFLEVAARVTKAAYDRRFEQIPQYAPIKFSGHEAGDFFLVPGG